MADQQITSFELDLTNYVDRQGAKVPEGDYLVRLVDAEYGTAQSSGNPKVDAYLEILDGDQKGQTLRDTLSLSPAARFKIVNLLNGMGLPTPRQKFTVNLNQWKGKIMEVTVKDREYNGNTYSNIAQYRRPSNMPQTDGDDLPQPAPQAQAQAEQAPAQAEQAAPAQQAQPQADQQAAPQGQNVQQDGQVDLSNLNLG